MPQWGLIDNSANSVVWVGEGINREPTVGDANVANQSTMFGNTTEGQFIEGVKIGQFGVDKGEQAASRALTARAAHAGWVLRKEGTGGRAGRVSYEVLVATKSITGDAEDDIFVDYVLEFLTQPVDSEDVTGNGASFSVSVQSTPSGATLAYTWQESPNVANSELWTDLSDGGVYTGTNTAILVISDNTGLNANAYRVRVSSAGADNVISEHAFVYETA